MTDVSLKEYFDRRLQEQGDWMAERFRLNDDAISKAERTMNARLDAMNEFRDALRDQANRMATRVELTNLTDIVNDLRREKANLDGRMAMVSLLISLIVSGLLMTASRLIAK